MMKVNQVLFVIGLLFSAQTAFAAETGQVDFTGSIMSDSCVITVKNKSVDLGLISKASIMSAGSVSSKKPFTINLNSCDPGQFVQLKLTGNTVSGKTDIIQTNGTASNVGVGIWESGDTNRMNVDSLSKTKSADATGLLHFDFEAAYVSLGNPTAGSANAAAVFEVVYP